MTEKLGDPHRHLNVSWERRISLLSLVSLSNPLVYNAIISMIDSCAMVYREEVNLKA